MPEKEVETLMIISYQAITGNNNHHAQNTNAYLIISYQAITGNNNAVTLAQL